MDISLDATSDELFMEEALRSAQRALEAGEVPVGARSSVAGATAILLTLTQRPMLRSSRSAKQVPHSATIVWNAASCLLQLSRARCVPARWCMLELNALCMARTILRLALSVR